MVIWREKVQSLQFLKQLISQFYGGHCNKIPQLWSLNEAATIKLPQLLLINKASSMRLPLDKCPHFAWHYTLLVPHLPSLVPVQFGLSQGMLSNVDDIVILI